MTVVVRYAQPEDSGEIARVFRDVVAPLTIYNQQARTSEIAKYSEASLLRRIRDDARAVCLAEVGGRCAGFAITEDQHGPVWIEWYGAHPAVRRCGVGRALMEFLISEAPSRNATKLWCDTRINNEASMALFEKLGFRRLCEVKNHWFGQDFYLWEKMV